MADNDALVLENATNAVLKIDLKYRQSDINEKLLLNPARDEAFNAYVSARLVLLQDGIVCTDADLAEMKALRTQMDSNVTTQAYIETAGKVAQLLLRIVA